MESDPLAQLRDIHLPADISWWPLAPGWWVLIVVLVFLFGWIISKMVKRYQANLYRRQALVKLEQIENSSANSNPLADIFAVLKQAANIAYPNRHFSSLGIDKFIDFLHSSCPSSLFGDLPDNLDTLLYADDPQQNKALTLNLLASAKIWIIEHRREAPQ
ncbi:MAG: DUF4381 domain-containing protein [Porticoccaceae bacterium]|nr:DUF4381 domain-containing protein [Porticoccaceae bacterium]